MLLFRRRKPFRKLSSSPVNRHSVTVFLFGQSKWPIKKLWGHGLWESSDFVPIRALVFHLSWFPFDFHRLFALPDGRQCVFTWKSIVRYGGGQDNSGKFIKCNRLLSEIMFCAIIAAVYLWFNLISNFCFECRDIFVFFSTFPFKFHSVFTVGACSNTTTKGLCLLSNTEIFFCNSWKYFFLFFLLPYVNNFLGAPQLGKFSSFVNVYSTIVG